MKREGMQTIRFCLSSSVLILLILSIPVNSFSLTKSLLLYLTSTARLPGKVVNNA